MKMYGSKALEFNLSLKYYSTLVISCILLQAWTSKGEQTVVAQLKVFQFNSFTAVLVRQLVH
jgi:hypothetical protein